MTSTVTNLGNKDVQKDAVSFSLARAHADTENNSLFSEGQYNEKSGEPERSRGFSFSATIYRVDSYDENATRAHVKLDSPQKDQIRGIALSLFVPAQASLLVGSPRSPGEIYQRTSCHCTDGAKGQTESLLENVI